MAGEMSKQTGIWFLKIELDITEIEPIPSVFKKLFMKN